MKSRMRGSDLIGRRPEPAATAPAKLSQCPGRRGRGRSSSPAPASCPGRRPTRAAGSGTPSQARKNNAIGEALGKLFKAGGNYDREYLACPRVP